MFMHVFACVDVHVCLACMHAGVCTCVYTYMWRLKVAIVCLTIFYHSLFLY